MSQLLQLGLIVNLTIWILSPPLIYPEILPDEITEFYAEQEEAGILVTWATTREEYTHHFVIQRSEDGENWINWMRKHALAEKGQGRTYSLKDRVPHEADVYYRIKQVDKKGHVLYHPKVLHIGVPSAESVFSGR